MSQSSSPIGLRLGASSFWGYPYDLFTYQESLDTETFVQRWIKGFFFLNYFYLFNLQCLYREGYFLYLNITLFSSRLYKRAKQRRKLALRTRTLVAKKKTLKRFFSRNYRKFGYIRLMLASKLHFIVTRLSFKLRSFYRTKLFLFKKKKPLNPRFYTARKGTFPVIRQRLLRLKHFFEQNLVNIVKKRVICFLTNIGEFSLSPQTKTLQHVTRFYQVLRATIAYFPKIPSHLIFLSAIYGKPTPALHWLYFYLARVKKHHVAISHQLYLNLFVTAASTLVYFSGILQGYRLLLRGKLGTNPRTRDHLFNAGQAVPSQTLSLRFVYDICQIPTYAGVLGTRLWYIY